MIDEGEDCDFGALCVKGSESTLSQPCQVDADCGEGGDCRPVGGQPNPQQTPGQPELPGCAANCKTEQVLTSNLRNTCTNAGHIDESCDPRSQNQCGQTCCAAYGAGCGPGITVCPCNGGTASTAQLTIGPINFPMIGTQVFRGADPRDTVVIGPSDKVLYQPGDIPTVIRANESNFEAIVIPSNACVCLRGFESDAFGPGNTAMGVIGCGEEGLPNVNYEKITNHRVGIVGESGFTAEQCLAFQIGGILGGEIEIEGGVCNGSGLCECTAPDCGDGGETWKPGDECATDADCNDPHPNYCTYVPDEPTFTGGGPRGSGTIFSNSSITTIADGGLCASGDCSIAGYGPDCIPCTADDPNQQPAALTVLTTGTATAAVLNANPNLQTGMTQLITLGSLATCRANTDCVQGERCYADITVLCSASTPNCQCRKSCGPTACLVQLQGKPFDCDLLESNLAQGITTGEVVSSFGGLHAAVGLDTVATTRLASGPAQ